MGLRRQRASDNAGQSAFDMAMTRYLHPRSRVRVFEPDWQKKLPTAVKILPEFDFETNQYRPYRDSAEADIASLGTFRMPLPIVKWVGTGGAEKSLSCILYDPQEDRESNGELSKANPYNVLRSAVRGAAYKSQDIKAFGKRIDTAVWLKYFNGARDDKAFPSAQMAAFMQAVFYTNRGKAAIDGPVPRGCGLQDDPMLLLVSGRAAEVIDKMLCETTDSHRDDGTPEEYDTMFKFGDVTKLDGGKILVLANPKEHEFSLLTGDEEDDKLLAAHKDSDGFNSYVPMFFDRVAVKDEKTNQKFRFGPSLAKFEKVLRERAVDWFADDLFMIPSVDQLCEWIAAAFSTTPELLEYGWSSNPEYYNLDTVQAIIRKRTQGYVPGAADTDDDADGGDAEVVDVDSDPDLPSMPTKERLKRVDEGAAKARKKANSGSSVYENVQTAINEEAETTEDAGIESPVKKKVVRVVRKKKA